MARNLIESSNYRQTITSDGTDTGAVIGNMNTTVDVGNQSLNINVILTHGATLPADAIIQQQLTDFIIGVRARALSSGLTQFADVSVN